MRLVACLILSTIAHAGLTPSKRELIEQLGPGTPEPRPLWPGKPPQFLENAAPEVIAENQTIKSVSMPTITPYLPPKESRNGMAVVVCAGGGYGGHAWKTHVVYAAHVLNPMGVAVIGLKYRTRPPHIVPNEGIQALTLLDAKRAIRVVRQHGAEWGIDPARVGIVGYSAGANLAMNLAANFDPEIPRLPTPSSASAAALPSPSGSAPGTGGSHIIHSFSKRTPRRYISCMPRPTNPSKSRKTSSLT